MPDLHKNFAYSTIATAPSPATTGTSLIVAGGTGGLFPTPPFNATIWPADEQPTSTNAEIVRVTNISTDTFTITRMQEGSGDRTILVGDQIAASITNRVLVEAEDVVSTWSPFILASVGQSTQSLMSNYTAQTGTGSVFVFPVTIPFNVQFNQIALPVVLSYVTSNQANAISASHYSKFGLYSISGNTLSLISSNSFSIGETLQSVSLTWNYPTTTATSGYGYGSFPSGNLTTTAQMVSYISGGRGVGLQFGGNMNVPGGMYWLGVLQLRSTAGSSTFGLSNIGILGNIINPINQAGTISGVLPLGIAGSQWSLSNSHLTGWWGRHVIGFVSATSLANQQGTAIPPSIEIGALGATAVASQGLILPSVTLVST